MQEDMDDKDYEELMDDKANKQETYPLKPKSDCCGEILLLSQSDLLPILEEKIGYKCDEAYLEDSALRLLKQSFKPSNCGCKPYKYIFVDLDDPTIMLQRFA